MNPRGISAERRASSCKGSLEYPSVPDVAQTISKDTSFARSIACPEPTSKIKMGPLLIIPFYRNPGLVTQISDSLLGARQEISALGSEVLFINDSPDDVELSRTLSQNRDRLAAAGLQVQIETNNANFGFIRSCNKGLAQSVQQRRHALILNSDTFVFPGFLSEMLAALDLDPMIGFVCPRSNNATICTFPHEAEKLCPPPNPDSAHELYLKHAAELPRFSYIPTGVGYCMLIRWQILENFGLLDVVYGKGYCEENDLTFRAGRCGYRSVLANRAFVWHQGEQSFSSTQCPKQVAEATNNVLLKSRYPEYQDHLDRYYSSPAYQFEKLLSKLPRNEQDELDIIFDFSSFGPYHNGTFEAGKRFLKVVLDSAPTRARFFVLMHGPAHKFHELDKLERVRRIDITVEQTATVWVRFGQYFEWEAMQRAVRRAPILVNFFLDTIAHDCTSLSTGFDPQIWSLMSLYHDIILTNSEFTKAQLESRFPLGPNVKAITCLHSTCPADYINQASSQKDIQPTPGSVLIVGNHFPHKSIETTTRHLESALAPGRIHVFGLAGIEGSKARFTASGALTDEEAFDIYRNSEVIVFPSHYEGFGFPLMNAIAAGRPIIVRNQPVYREILAALSPVPHVYFYDTEPELVRILQSTDFSQLPPLSVEGAVDWTHSSRIFWQALQDKLASIDIEHIKTRLTVYGGLPGRPPARPPLPPKLGLVKGAIEKLRQVNRKRVDDRRQRRKAKSEST